MLLAIADFALHGLHLAVIALNLFGWMIARLRLVSFTLQLITIGFWVGFGALKGWWGYCPLTHWHWQVKASLGEQDLPGNYILYIAEQWFGIAMSHDLSTGLIAGTFMMALLINSYLLTRRISAR